MSGETIVEKRHDILGAPEAMLHETQAMALRRVRDAQAVSARRVIAKIARNEGWPRGEAREVLESLGLRQPS